METERIRAELIATGRDTRYPVQAYQFVMRALEYAHERSGEARHVSGRELLERFAEFSLGQFGALTLTTLSRMGIHATADVGHIIFNLVDIGIVRRREGDKLDDFSGVYDFEERFAPGNGDKPVAPESIRRIRGV